MCCFLIKLPRSPNRRYKHPLVLYHTTPHPDFFFNKKLHKTPFVHLHFIPLLKPGNLIRLQMFSIFKFSFSTMAVVTTFSRLPPSIITVHTLPFEVHLVWKILFLDHNSSSVIATFNDLQTTKDSH